MHIDLCMRGKFSVQEATPTDVRLFCRYLSECDGYTDFFSGLLSLRSGREYGILAFWLEIL